MERRRSFEREEFPQPITKVAPSCAGRNLAMSAVEPYHSKPEVESTKNESQYSREAKSDVEEGSSGIKPMVEAGRQARSR